VFSFHAFIVTVITIAVYFLPAFLGRNKKNFLGISCINLFLGWTIVGWVLALVWALKSSAAPVKEPTHVCLSCGSQVDPKSITPGTIGMEVVLWLCFFIPGLVYSIWRVTNRYKGCPVCGTKNIIPINTPAAQGILAGQLTGTTITKTAFFLAVCIGGATLNAQPPCPAVKGMYVLNGEQWQKLESVHPQDLRIDAISYGHGGVIATFSNAESPFRVNTSAPMFCDVSIEGGPESFTMLRFKDTGNARRVMVAHMNAWYGYAEHRKEFQKKAVIHVSITAQENGTFLISPEDRIQPGEYILLTSTPDLIPGGYTKSFDPHQVCGYDFGYFSR